MVPLCGWTAHEDMFTFDHGPSPEAMPWLDEEWFERRGIGRAPFNAAFALVESHLTSAHAHRPAIIDDDEIVSFAALASRTARLASVLQDDFNIRPGNRVLVQMHNSAWCATAFFAVLRAGAVAVLCSPLLTRDDVAVVMHQTSPCLMLRDLDIASSLGACDGVRDANLPTIARSLSMRDNIRACVRTAPTDPAVLLFTSGSTGAPKACIHFHRDLIVAAESYGREVVPVGPGDVLAGSASLAFAYGLETLLLTPLRHGATAALTRDRGMLPLLLSVRDHAVTHVYSSPSIYMSMLEFVDEGDFAKVKACVSAGEGLSAFLIDAWRNRTGLSIANGLGSSELNAFLTGSPPGEAADGSAGRPVPGFSVRIVSEDGSDAPSGTTGRLAMRGPTGCRYLALPQEQGSSVVDGWTMMGDMFEQDALGALWSRGRSDDLIVKGGIKIAPMEIENVIAAAPAVSECAVVGSFHQKLQTELICAFVVLKNHEQLPSDAAERVLRSWANDRLAINKVPDKIVFCSVLPRNANGKIQKTLLRTSPVPRD